MGQKIGCCFFLAFFASPTLFFLHFVLVATLQYAARFFCLVATLEKALLSEVAGQNL